MDSIEVRDAVEREGQHELSSPRGPAERGFGVTHAFAGADDAPKDVCEARTRAFDRLIEPTLGVELGPVEIRRRAGGDRGARYPRLIPRHRHSRGELRAFPVCAKTLARVILPPRQQPAHE